jgi:Na+-transporting methylmalonyl-CoA/oxaloacetate decarboxylase gamma subunit
MGQGANLFFNTVSMIFLVLTVLVAIVVLSVATGSMDPPIFAPDETSIPATQFVPVTLTPSPGPDMNMTLETTPEPGDQ